MNTLLLPLAALLLASAAHADDDTGRHAPLLPAYRQACAECHVAYPPRLLSAPAWQRIMQTLPTHFGSDASLEPAEVAAIGTWLQAQAGPASRVQPTDMRAPRLTQTPWFQREHREVPADAWTRRAVGSAANCAACHRDAAQGRYSEREVRIPR